jgi:uncharacterized protein with WD repeat
MNRCTKGGSQFLPSSTSGLERVRCQYRGQPRASFAMTDHASIISYHLAHFACAASQTSIEPRGTLHRSDALQHLTTEGSLGCRGGMRHVGRLKLKRRNNTKKQQPRGNTKQHQTKPRKQQHKNRQRGDKTQHTAQRNAERRTLDRETQCTEQRPKTNARRERVRNVTLTVVCHLWQRMSMCV